MLYLLFEVHKHIDNGVKVTFYDNLLMFRGLNDEKEESLGLTKGHELLCISPPQYEVN